MNRNKIVRDIDISDTIKILNNEDFRSLDFTRDENRFQWVIPNELISNVTLDYLKEKFPPDNFFIQLGYWSMPSQDSSFGKVTMKNISIRTAKDKSEAMKTHFCTP